MPLVILSAPLALPSNYFSQKGGSYHESHKHSRVKPESIHDIRGQCRSTSRTFQSPSLKRRSRRRTRGETKRSTASGPIQHGSLTPAAAHMSQVSGCVPLLQSCMPHIGRCGRVLHYKIVFYPLCFSMRNSIRSSVVACDATVICSHCYSSQDTH